MNMEESTNGSLAAEFRHLVGDFLYTFNCVSRGCGRKLAVCLLVIVYLCKRGTIN